MSDVPSEAEQRHYLLPVLHLTLEAPWQIGAVTLHPAGSATTLVEDSRQRRGWRHNWYDDHLDAADVPRLDETVVGEVRAFDPRNAYDLVADALGVLRLYQATLSPMADTSMQTFGLPGQVETWSVRYLTLESGPGAGFFHGGAHPGWTFRLGDHQAFVGDAGWQYLAGSIRWSDADATPIERRIRLGARLLNSALLDYDIDRKLLSLVTALEVMLSEESWAAKKFGLARRAAFLSCSVPGKSMCGRDRESCPYLAVAPLASGRPPGELASLIERATRDVSVRCSRYLDMLDLYDTRNAAVHSGRAGLEFDDVRSIVWQTLQWVVPRLLSWCAIHVGADLDALDAEIAAAVAARPPLPIPPE